MEPALKPIFRAALWIADTMTLDDPGAAVADLAASIVARGGAFSLGEVVRIMRAEGAWIARLADGTAHRAARLVVALGPWTPEMLAPLGLTVPMLFERGAHREFEPTGLRHAVHDVDGGYVLAPLAGRMRLTSGVDLAARDAPTGPRMLDAAEGRAREAIGVMPARSGGDWHGSRPTLPDSLPVLGPSRLPGLWLAFGHQHVGMATGPASGEILAALLSHRAPPIDPAPYAPTRFGL